MAQMALLPIIGLGGFQSSGRNTQALTSDNYLVACVWSLLPKHTATYLKKKKKKKKKQLVLLELKRNVLPC